MKRILSPGLPVYIIAAAFLLLVNCGSDRTAPADPSTTSEIPDIVFFNTGDPSAVFLFEGRATDNTRVEEVLISFDNGAVWHTAAIDNTSPNTLWNVEWTYPAAESEIPAVMNTVLIKATDGDANETISSPIPLEKQSGGSVGALQSAFTGLVDGQTIGLSSGSGGAYGNGVDALKIPIDKSITVLGSGYGSGVTSGGVSFPSVASTATFLQAPLSSASIFSVDADLTLKRVRLLGAGNAVQIFDSAGPDPQLTIEDCVFDGQGAWAVYAEDDDAFVNVEFLSSIVDASQADSSGGGGGLYLDNVKYTVSESEFYLHSAVDAGAGVQVLGGAGSLYDCIFEENSLAIWASGGEAVITSCNISGAAFTTDGINLSGGPGSAVIRSNTIDGHTGGYGLRIGGEMALILRNNAITNNELSGVLIDTELSNTNLINIDMGQSTDKGNNLFNENYHPDGVSGFETQVYVTLDTQEGSTLIPANWNYWGVGSIPEVNIVIIDGNDNAARAKLAIGNVYLSEVPEVGP